MIDVAIAGPSIPRFARAEVIRFVSEAVRVLRKLGVREPGREISLAFIDDATMRKLNRRFRGRNKTTDVLTFPGDESGFLGEIVISVDQARRQAAGQRHSLATEIRYLLLHGIIHAFGFDHETDSGEMNALEMKVRAAVGLE